MMTKISNCLELFTGAGGLAKGIELSGIQHKALVEWNTNAHKTLIQNYQQEIVYHVDIRQLSFHQFGNVDMIAGGPPCQPFSIGGKHQGEKDPRDLFPWACKAISICTPKIFIFENVKGILRKSFANYFEYILLRLTYPDIVISDLEDWTDHFIRLKKIQSLGKFDGIQYHVTYRLVDAANYGIPQRRERVFIVGIRQDLDIDWSFPQETHSLDSLLWSQFIDVDYWKRHQIQPGKLEFLDQQLQRKVIQMRKKPELLPPLLKPWKTVRDQIGQLPQPDVKGSFDREHILKKGAKIYPGHTGSYIDLPSKALKAGDHGVPGGENMIRYQDGQVRYYTTYEAKQIQTFPKDYKILGSWTETMRQIGNAVPVELSYYIVNALVKVIEQQGNSKNL